MLQPCRHVRFWRGEAGARGLAALPIPKKVALRGAARCLLGAQLQDAKALAPSMHGMAMPGQAGDVGRRQGLTLLAARMRMPRGPCCVLRMYNTHLAQLQALPSLAPDMRTLLLQAAPARL